MQTAQLTVLISCAGRRVELIQCFREDAARMGLRLRVVATDTNPTLSAACHAADVAVEVPHSSAPSFAASMLAVCREHEVNLVVPTIDAELPALAEAKASFAAAGVWLLVSSPSVVGLAADKFTTAMTLAALGVVTPRTLRLKDYQENPAALAWPVIIKPVSGSSSYGVVRPQTQAEAIAVSDKQEMIAQEKWMGREYTVNVFFDVQSRVRCIVPHERIEVRAGEVSKGITRRMPALDDVAKKLSQALLGITGPMCFQSIVNNLGECAVFEINARFGGGYPLAHRAGARFTQWLLEDACGLPSSANNDWKEGVTMLRYDSTVFIDG